jgi:hypothetical protein
LRLEIFGGIFESFDNFKNLKIGSLKADNLGAGSLKTVNLKDDDLGNDGFGLIA